MEIDDSLYSRQRCVLGEDAMRKMSESKVFLYGLGGLGIEIAKNLVLGGIQELIIQDNTLCSYADLGTQFFVRKSDIEAGKTRAEASLPHLAELNPYVRVVLDANDLTTIRSPLTDVANQALLKSLWNCDQVEARRVQFIYTDVHGVLGNLFCDFGPDFLITDPDGEPAKEFFIGHIEKQESSKLLVKVFGDRRHHLETGHVVQFREVYGMTELNGRTFAVRVLSPSELLIEVETDELSPYTGGGIGLQIIQPQRRSFKTLLEQLRQPTIVTTDLSRPDEGILLHHVFLTLMKFKHEEKRLPQPWCENDGELFITKFEELRQVSPHDLGPPEYLTLVRRLALVSQGQVPALCAFFGGVAAQEAMKALTGHFSPFNQWLYMHCESVMPRNLESRTLCLNGSRYDPLTVCIGPLCLQRLRHLSAFLVGCGAIGCELLKNLALLGVATDSDDNTDCRPSITSITSASMRTDTQGCFFEDLPIFTDVSISHRSNPPVSNPNSSRSASLDNSSIIPPRSVHGEAGDVLDREFAPFSSSHVTASSLTSTTRHANVVESPHGASELGDYARLQGNDGSLFLPHSPILDPLNVKLCSSNHFSPTVERDSPTVHSEGTLTLESSRSFSAPPLKEESTTVIPVEQSRTQTSTEGYTSISEINDGCGSSSQLVEACTTGTPIMDEVPGCAATVETARALTSSAEQPVASSLHSKVDFSHPCLTITDPDHIEKSNLNRQFLFRSEHIGRSKSLVAAEAARAINPAMVIRPMEQKVWPANEKTVFTDTFLLHSTGSDGDRCANGVVFAALDCVSSRRYLDTRCVALRLPLYESGTLGTKGHVQVVLPGLTESYNSQRDDDSGFDGASPDGGGQSIPYCTLKSFPTLPVHCIEWAKEKFASQFTLKPEKLSQLLTALDRNEPGRQLLELATHLIASSAESQNVLEIQVDSAERHVKATWLCSQLTVNLARFLASRPVDWVGCVQLARDKFERYFNHKARHLLHAFPPDTRTADGSLFWLLPKRQPTPILFNPGNKLHQQFVLSYARLLADQLRIPLPECIVNPEHTDIQTHLEACLIGHNPPAFIPSSKRIVVEESETPSMSRSEPYEEDGNLAISGSNLDEFVLQALHMSIAALKDSRKLKSVYSCHAIAFEKDNDRLPHVDFIAAAANLRAVMYGLQQTPRHEVRRIAGRIVPAIATTTAAVAGLVCIELLKHVAYCVNPEPSDEGKKNAIVNVTEIEHARNAFLNLALPVILLSEPAPCVRTKLPSGAEFTLWDRWVIPAPANLDSYLLSDLIYDIKRRHMLEAAVITQGNRMVYVNYLPVHKSRLSKPLKSLLTCETDDGHVDLMIAYDPGPDATPDADFIQGPPVRFMLTAS
ncbi:hypothetical protein EG68_01616 [Paragonimus skrjabini miyazakii]|uniref:Ubiquitin-activating enzyme E1 C-terminal domain-containing protein n=1 Tax=Paragonimus skrjabini miyazakii TaxID=59628 RepID=A0A8S9Z7A0_9TREM|nr:hypothetical protein EG68_01616 [Paragonimus skrjabini miyazakii]